MNTSMDYGYHKSYSDPNFLYIPTMNPYNSKESTRLSNLKLTLYMLQPKLQPVFEWQTRIKC